MNWNGPDYEQDGTTDEDEHDDIVDQKMKCLENYWNDEDEDEE